MEDFRNIIVIGASSGGLPAIKQVIKDLPEDTDAAVVVVLHVSHKSNPQVISREFQNRTALHCEVPINGQSIEKGHLYLAPP